MNAFAVASDTKCADSATGSLSLSATGGSGNYKFSVNGGTFTSSITRTSLSKGSYSIVAQDKNLCESSLISRSISDPDGNYLYFILFILFYFFYYYSLQLLINFSFLQLLPCT